MIRYDLSCKDGHRFDGWFASSAAFETQRDQGQVNCAICGSAEVDRALMSPGVAAKSNRAASGPGTARSKTPLEQLRDHVEANSDYVGMSFAEEARADA